MQIFRATDTDDEVYYQKVYFVTNRETLLIVSAVVCSYLQGPSVHSVRLIQRCTQLWQIVSCK